MSQIMRHILCAIDFSEASDWAFTRALAAAEGLRCGLRVLNVKDINELEPQARMCALAQRAQARGVAFEALILEGDPAHEIVAASQDPDCALVVLGPARPRTPGAWLLGTTGEQVIRASPIAVLAVHGAPAGAGAYGRALACLDFGQASRAALQDALVLGLASAKGLAVVHAYLAPLAHMISRVPIPSGEIERNVLAAGNEATISVRAILVDLGVIDAAPPVFLKEGDPSEAIADAMSKWRPDLLIMGSQGRGPVNDLVLGSVVREALRSVPCDVLVRRAPV